MKKLLLSLIVGLALSQTANAAETDFAQQCTSLKETKIYNTLINKAEFVQNGSVVGDKAAVLSGASGTNDTLVPHCLLGG